MSAALALPVGDVYRRAIAAAEALRLLDVTLARDPEQHRVPAHLDDVDRRAEEVRAELQLLAEALQAAGQLDVAEAARLMVEDVRIVVAGGAPVDDLDAFRGWCEVRAQEAAHG